MTNLNPGTSDDWPVQPDDDSFHKMMEEFAQRIPPTEPEQEIVIDPPTNPPTLEQAATFVRLMPMLIAFHQDMSELSKKKQDGIVNGLKIRNINRLLDELYKLLEDEPSHLYVERLDEATLPQNSDVVLLLSQWRTALEQYEQRYTQYDQKSERRRWIVAQEPDRAQGT